MRPVEGEMLVTDKPTLILATEASIGTKPDSSLTLTSQDPAAAGVDRVQVIWVDVMVPEHSEFAMLILVGAEVVPNGRFVPVIVS